MVGGITIGEPVLTVNNLKINAKYQKYGTNSQLDQPFVEHMALIESISDTRVTNTHIIAHPVKLPHFGAGAEPRMGAAPASAPTTPKAPVAAAPKPSLPTFAFPLPLPPSYLPAHKDGALRE